MADDFYDHRFYEEISDGARRSASVVVPILLRILPGVRSVIDFGCGAGVWLAEFELCGVLDVAGVDFGQGTDEYMFVSRERFRVADLSRPMPGLGKHDLAMSVEVAEHLPETAAQTFVRNVTSAADVVLFSAATPLQGGHNHVNERWPSYWIRLFRQMGFRCHDVIRPVIWKDKRVEWWYRQNLLLFTREGVGIPALQRMPSFEGLDLVHPDNVASRFHPGHDEVGPWNRINAAREALVDRLREPRAPPLRRLRRAGLNLERAARKAIGLALGEPKALFKKRWQARLDRRLIARSRLFDAAWYVQTYPDVAASGLRPFQHFLQIGLADGRDPGPLFSTRWHAARHRWLAEANVHPLVHYLRQISAPPDRAAR
jgi:SAM-dependent methyltransferase